MSRASTLPSVLCGLALLSCSSSHDQRPLAQLAGQPQAGSGTPSSKADPAGADEGAPGVATGVTQAGETGDRRAPEATPDAAATTSEPATVVGAVLPSDGPGLEVWVGQTHGALFVCSEDYQGGWASDHRERVLLLLEREHGEVVAASAIFGTGEPPAAPSATQAPYPAGATWWDGIDEQAQCPNLFPVAGFEYPAHTASVHGTRLELGFHAGDFYHAWCVSQPSVPAPEAFSGIGLSHVCGPVDEADPGDWCLSPASPCECDASGCRGHGRDPWVFDLLDAGDELGGRVVTPGSFGSTEVRLRRAS